jgi:Na+/H+-dicarboxylate symporter
MKWLGLASIVALALGIFAGMWVDASSSEGVKYAGGIFEAVGSLWLNALRMTVIPLIVALLITGVASTVDAAQTGKLAARAVMVFGVMLVVATLYGFAATGLAITLFPVDAASASALTATTGRESASTASLTVAEWIKSLAPSNLIAAAADDAVLPLVLFSILLGFAATQLPDGRRKPLIDFFQALADATIIIVRWVLVLAPVGVFGLALGVGHVAGAGAVGVLLHYVILVAAVIAGVTPIAYIMGVVVGRIPPGKYLVASAPVQILAVSTQSSLACLPAMLTASREMGVHARATSLTLPLAVTLFRMTSPVGNIAVVMFIAHVMGVAIGPLQILAGGVVAIAMSIGTVGLPGQTSYVLSISPIALAMGVPTDLLGVLVAVEVIPDIFRTVGNVTGDMSAAAIVDRNRKSVDVSAAAEPAA